MIICNTIKYYKNNEKKVQISVDNLFDFQKKYVNIIN